jgi:hypothetical protein
MIKQYVYIIIVTIFTPSCGRILECRVQIPFDACMFVILCVIVFDKTLMCKVEL